MSWFIPSRKNRHHFLEKHDRREIEKKHKSLKGFESSITGKIFVGLPSSHLCYLNGRVLIIAEMSIPQCRYYRVQQKVDMLKYNGIDCDVANWTDSCVCLQFLQFASIVIFYRVPYNETVSIYYLEARRLGIKIGFDIDDLVFDKTEYMKNNNLKSLDRKELENILRGVEYYSIALSHADFTIASTTTLQQFMKRHNPGPAYVIPNGLIESLSQKIKIKRNLEFPLWGKVDIVIGYGSGTNTHNYDFALCVRALLRVLEEFRELRLVIHGELLLPKEFDKFRDKIYRVNFVTFSDYLKAIRRFDINLIPLEKTFFNDSKSNIKFLEASFYGIPSVASPCAEFVREIRNGENGFLASNEEEWYIALRNLISSESLRKDIGKCAKKDVLAKYNLDTIFQNSFLPLLQDQRKILPSPKRKILVVNILYSPLSFGGATVLTEKLVTEYKRYADPYVFCGCFTKVPHFPGFINRYAHEGVPIFSYEFAIDKNLSSNNYTNVSCSSEFRFLMEKVRPDIVHFNSIQFLGVEMLQVCSELKIPYIVTVHDAWWICKNQFMITDSGNFCGLDKTGVDLYKCIECTHSSDLFSRWDNLMNKLYQADKVLAPSDYQRKLYIKSGLPAEKILTNRNGIVLPEKVFPHQLHKTLTFAYIGGKCKHKGYFFLQRIIKKLHGEYRLKLVDIEMNFGRKSISENEWEKPEIIECCTPFLPQDIDKFYSQIDVLLFPSCWKESFGLSIREALARNIWVVSTDAGGDISKDIHDGENGNICPMFDEDTFVNILQNLIDHPEKLNNFENPYRFEITSVRQQATEIWGIIKGILEKQQG